MCTSYPFFRQLPPFTGSGQPGLSISVVDLGVVEQPIVPQKADMKMRVENTVMSKVRFKMSFFLFPFPATGRGIPGISAL